MKTNRSNHDSSLTYGAGGGADGSREECSEYGGHDAPGSDGTVEMTTPLTHYGNHGPGLIEVLASCCCSLKSDESYPQGEPVDGASSRLTKTGDEVSGHPLESFNTRKVHMITVPVAEARDDTLLPNVLNLLAEIAEVLDSLKFYQIAKQITFNGYYNSLLNLANHILTRIHTCAGINAFNDLLMAFNILKTQMPDDVNASTAMASPSSVIDTRRIGHISPPIRVLFFDVPAPPYPILSGFPINPLRTKVDEMQSSRGILHMDKPVEIIDGIFPLLKKIGNFVISLSQDSRREVRVLPITISHPKCRYLMAFAQKKDNRQSLIYFVQNIRELIQELQVLKNWCHLQPAAGKLESRVSPFFVVMAKTIEALLSSKEERQRQEKDSYRALENCQRISDDHSTSDANIVAIQEQETSRRAPSGSSEDTEETLEITEENIRSVISDIINNNLFFSLILATTEYKSLFGYPEFVCLSDVLYSIGNQYRLAQQFLCSPAFLSASEKYPWLPQFLSKMPKKPACTFSDMEKYAKVVKYVGLLPPLDHFWFHLNMLNVSYMTAAERSTCNMGSGPLFTNSKRTEKSLLKLLKNLPLKIQVPGMIDIIDRCAQNSLGQQLLDLLMPYELADYNLDNTHKKAFAKQRKNLNTKITSLLSILFAGFHSIPISPITPEIASLPELNPERQLSAHAEMADDMQPEPRRKLSVHAEIMRNEMSQIPTIIRNIYTRLCTQLSTQLHECRSSTQNYYETIQRLGQATDFLPLIRALTNIDTNLPQIESSLILMETFRDQLIRHALEQFQAGFLPQEIIIYLARRRINTYLQLPKDTITNLLENHLSYNERTREGVLNRQLLYHMHHILENETVPHKDGAAAKEDKESSEDPEILSRINLFVTLQNHIHNLGDLLSQIAAIQEDRTTTEEFVLTTVSKTRDAILLRSAETSEGPCDVVDAVAGCDAKQDGSSVTKTGEDTEECDDDPQAPAYTSAPSAPDPADILRSLPNSVITTGSGCAGEAPAPSAPPNLSNSGISASAAALIGPGPSMFARQSTSRDSASEETFYQIMAAMDALDLQNRDDEDPAAREQNADGDSAAEGDEPRNEPRVAVLT